jgi:hypothetical protein
MACLTLAAAVLSVADTCALAASAQPSIAARQAPEGRRPAGHARCPKPGRHRAGSHTRATAGRPAGRACRRKGDKLSGIVRWPAEPMSEPPVPISSPKSGEVAPNHPAPLPAAPQTPPANPEPPSNPPAAPSEAPFRFFSPSSFWNTPLLDDATLDPDSAALTDAFETTIMRGYQTGNGPWINTTDYSVPIYTVAADQPTVRVQLSSPFSAPALQSAWSAVPIPADARPASGTDRTLVVWQPSADRMWEFWKLAQAGGEWTAAWGGAMQGVSANQGVYGPEAWPGAKAWWGSSASSLSIAGGLITLDDLQHGQIDHALALAIPNVRANFYASPAQRSDGDSSSPLSLPEGAHLRLDPSLDLVALHLPHLTLMIAEAAQRYGIYIRDRAKVTHFFAQDPTPTGANPYGGAGGYFEGRSPAQLLSQFPWDRLQLLQMDLRRWD